MLDLFTLGYHGANTSVPNYIATKIDRLIRFLSLLIPYRVIFACDARHCFQSEL